MYPHMIPILDYIIIPFIDKLHALNEVKQMLFFTSRVSFLRSFFSFFMIFFNELRKYLIIHELTPKNDVPQKSKESNSINDRSKLKSQVDLQKIQDGQAKSSSKGDDLDRN